MGIVKMKKGSILLWMFLLSLIISFTYPSRKSHTPYSLIPLCLDYIKKGRSFPPHLLPHPLLLTHESLDCWFPPDPPQTLAIFEPFLHCLPCGEGRFPREFGRLLLGRAAIEFRLS
jgi:hypothetical protein